METTKTRKNKTGEEYILTPRQDGFAREYARTGNAYQSAKSAGYSLRVAKSTKLKLLSKDKVRERVLEYIKDYQPLSKDEAYRLVERTFTEIAEGGKKQETKIMAAEKLGKLTGLMSENVNLRAEIETKSIVVSAILTEIGLTPNTENQDQTSK